MRYKTKDHPHKRPEAAQPCHVQGKSAILRTRRIRTECGSRQGKTHSIHSHQALFCAWNMRETCFIQNSRHFMHRWVCPALFSAAMPSYTCCILHLSHPLSKGRLKPKGKKKKNNLYDRVCPRSTAEASAQEKYGLRKRSGGNLLKVLQRIAPVQYAREKVERREAAGSNNYFKFAAEKIDDIINVLYNQ